MCSISTPPSARPVPGAPTTRLHRHGICLRVYADRLQPSRPFRRRSWRTPVPKDFPGQKWFFFVNYEGLRLSQRQHYSTSVPSALLRAGVIQVQNAAGVYQPYNLNPAAGNREWRDLSYRRFARRAHAIRAASASTPSSPRSGARRCRCPTIRWAATLQHAGISGHHPRASDFQ